MKGQGLVIAALIGLGLWAWSQRRVEIKAETTPLTDPKLTLEQALAQSIVYLTTIARKYSDDPTLAAAVSQAINTISINVSKGVLPAEDPGAATFVGQVKAYEIYRAEGGTKSFEDFTLYTDIKAESPAAYAAIEAEKQAYNQREADSIIASITDPQNLVEYVTLYANEALKAELLKRPEVQAALKATATLAPVLPPPPPAAPAPPVVVPIEDWYYWESPAPEPAAPPAVEPAPAPVPIEGWYYW